MKNIAFKSLTILLVLGGACSDSFFEKLPPAAASAQQFNNERGIDLLLIGAYSLLDGVGATSGGTRDYGNTYLLGGAASNWVTSDVRAGDALKGSVPFDITEGFQIERHDYQLNNLIIAAKWQVCFDGVSRCNEVLKAIINTKDVSQEVLDAKAAEARFLRAHYYSELKKVYKNVPWIDELTTDFRQPNTTEIWPMIEDDFEFAAERLPATQTEVGRATSGAANAYLAKTYIFQGKFTEAKPILEAIISSGRYELNSCFRDNFDIATKNSKETVFGAQHSVNDGAPESDNGNWGDILNQPLTVEGQCCGFHKPSYDLVNAYQTDVNGLPLLDTYQDSQIKNDYYPTPVLSTEPFTPYDGPLDPRLDWTIGRRGIPYLDWGVHPGGSWMGVRDYGGPYSPKKTAFRKTQQLNATTTVGWAPGADASTINLIRYADVILWAAEVEAEVGDPNKARDYVNQIRNRAKNGCWVMAVDANNVPTTTPAANYVIEPYTNSWDKAFAIKAVRFERRLEFGMEGHRFFDLVRWGIAKQSVDQYLEKETVKRVALQGAEFTENKEEYWPIPESEIINSSKNGIPTLTQNPGY